MTSGGVMAEPIRENLAVVILAGGESSRFGSDKAQAIVGGLRSIDRIAYSALEIASDVAVVGGEGPLPAGVDIRISDMAPAGGPVQAVLSAFREYPNKDLLVLACDLPLLASPHLRYLSRSLPKDIVARVPKSTMYPMPLCALYAPEAQRVFHARWALGDRSMRAVLSHLEIEWLSFDALRAEGLEPESLNDFDTPQDLDLIRQLEMKARDP